MYQNIVYYTSAHMIRMNMFRCHRFFIERSLPDVPRIGMSLTAGSRFRVREGHNAARRVGEFWTLASTSACFIPRTWAQESWSRESSKLFLRAYEVGSVSAQPYLFCGQLMVHVGIPINFRIVWTTSKLYDFSENALRVKFGSHFYTRFNEYQQFFACCANCAQIMRDSK